jgi:hypothetical protein
MFVEIYHSRWMQELGELDRLMDKNLEQVLEQRYLLARLDVGREADLIEKFLQDLLSTRQIYFARGCLRDHAAKPAKATQAGPSDQDLCHQ